jgi:uncharacterized protein YndB with AHSA1/START domain
MNSSARLSCLSKVACGAFDRAPKGAPFGALVSIPVMLLLLACQAAAGAEWHPSAEVQARLARGEVVLESSESDREMDKGDVRAVVQIDAPPEHVFRTMTTCEHAMRYVPRIKQCKVLETARDGSWQTVEHEVDGNSYLPRTRYVFRADFERFKRIRCTEVSGDFRENRGVWTFRPVKDSTATLVTYTVHIVPRFYAPRWAVRASLKRELPMLMSGLRQVAQDEADPISSAPAAGLSRPLSLSGG